jgi:hypothetical protein
MVKGDRYFVCVMLSIGELTALENFRYEQRMPNRTAAVRELLRRALAAEAINPQETSAALNGYARRRAQAFTRRCFLNANTLIRFGSDAVALSNLMTFADVPRTVSNDTRPMERCHYWRADHAVLFNIGKSLIAWYLGSSAIASRYGAADGLIVLLLWVYYSAQIFLLGSEFTKTYANQHGSKRRRPVSEGKPVAPSLTLKFAATNAEPHALLVELREQPLGRYHLLDLSVF